MLIFEMLLKQANVTGASDAGMRGAGLPDGGVKHSRVAGNRQMASLACAANRGGDVYASLTR